MDYRFYRDHLEIRLHILQSFSWQNAHVQTRCYYNLSPNFICLSAGCSSAQGRRLAIFELPSQTTAPSCSLENNCLASSLSQIVKGEVANHFVQTLRLCNCSSREGRGPQWPTGFYLLLCLNPSTKKKFDVINALFKWLF